MQPNLSSKKMIIICDIVYQFERIVEIFIKGQKVFQVWRSIPIHFIVWQNYQVWNEYGRVQVTRCNIDWSWYPEKDFD